MSGVDIAGLVERLRAAINLGDQTGSRGKRPENIYNVADDALTALLAQAAELAEARQESLRKDLQMATLRNQRDAARGRAGEQFVRCGEALQRAVIATRQRDKALAALKASEERGERLREEARNADGELYRDLWKASSKNVARVCGVANRQRDLIDACAPFLKDGETPRERMDRDFADSQALMSLLADARSQRDSALEALKPFADTVERVILPGDTEDSRIVTSFTVRDLRRARSVLENGSANLADATNNPPSDPGTEQREAGV